MIRRFSIRHGIPALGSLILILCLVPAVFADDWPQWLGPKRDGVWREKGILEKFPEGGLMPRWSASIGSGYAGPAVALGKVYVFDRLLAAGVKNPDNPFNTAPVAGKER